MRWLMAAALAMAACGPLLAQTKTDSLTTAVGEAVDRGELLYIYDEAAWHGTDDIRVNYPQLLAKAGGYVVTGDEAKTELVFYDRSKSSSVYRATFSNGNLIKSGQPTAAQVDLTSLEKRMIAAKDTALRAFTTAKVGMCNKGTPNLAALPPRSASGSITVYLMTPRIDMNLVPLGGHYSLEVSADGTVGAIRHFTNACIDMPLGSNRPSAAGVFGITHLLDPNPTEIHVFSSLTAKVPIIVATSPAGRIWVVDGNQVTTLPVPKP